MIPIRCLVLFCLVSAAAPAEPPALSSEDLCRDIDNQSVKPKSIYLAKVTLSLGVQVAAQLRCSTRDLGFWITNVDSDNDVSQEAKVNLSRLSDRFLNSFRISTIDIVALLRMSPGMAIVRPLDERANQAKAFKTRTCKSKDDRFCFKILQFVVVSEGADVLPR